MSENINGGFPPIKIEQEYKKDIKDKEKKSVERFYAPTSLNIVKILNTKKVSNMISQDETIDAIDSL